MLRQLPDSDQGEAPSVTGAMLSKAKSAPELVQLLQARGCCGGVGGALVVVARMLSGTHEPPSAPASHPHHLPSE